MKPTRVFFAAAVLTAAAQVNAECPIQFPAEVPAVPSGSNASATQMLSAQNEIKDFVEKGEAFLECNTLHYLRHNRFQARLADVAEQYNAQLEQFRARETVTSL